MTSHAPARRRASRRPRAVTEIEQSASGHIELLGSTFLEALHSIVASAKMGALVAAFPSEARAELQAFRDTLVRELRTFSSWPVRRGVLRGARASMIAVFSGELQAGAALSGVNLFRGKIAGGSLTGCNAALATVEDGEVRLVNVLAGTVHGGIIRGVNLIAADIFGGEVDHCAVLAGTVFGGRVRVGLLVGDVMGGDVRAARHFGKRHA